MPLAIPRWGHEGLLLLLTGQPAPLLVIGAVMWQPPAGGTRMHTAMSMGATWLCGGSVV